MSLMHRWKGKNGSLVYIKGITVQTEEDPGKLEERFLLNRYESLLSFQNEAARMVQEGYPVASHSYDNFCFVRSTSLKDRKI